MHNQSPVVKEANNGEISILWKGTLYIFYPRNWMADGETIGMWTSQLEPSWAFLRRAFFLPELSQVKNEGSTWAFGLDLTNRADLARLSRIFFNLLIFSLSCQQAALFAASSYWLRQFSCPNEQQIFPFLFFFTGRLEPSRLELFSGRATSVSNRQTRLSSLGDHNNHHIGYDFNFTNWVTIFEKITLMTK